MKTDKELLSQMCELVSNASLYWTGVDEEKNPDLKKLRTLAGLITLERFAE